MHSRLVLWTAVMAIAVVGSTIVATLQYLRAEGLEGKAQKTEEALEVAKLELLEIEERKESLLVYAADYKAHVSTLVTAVEELEKFDTEEVRKELGLEEFNKQRQGLVGEIKIHSAAFNFFVDPWRKVFEAFGLVVNGKITNLKINAEAGNEKEMLDAIEIINQNMESDIRRLESMLRLARFPV